MLLAISASYPLAAQFDGEKALAWTRKAVEIGPRPAGSPAIARLQEVIRGELKAQGWTLSEDAFTADTPVGKVPMRNIIGTLPGASGQSIVFSGHYDTKQMPGFVGANDGGASTGWLLEMARVVPKIAGRKDGVMLVFFDGEEAFGQWSDTNGVFGSRHLAQLWFTDGTLRKVRAMFNVDMIGDRNLKVLDEERSSPSLRRLIRASAIDLGLAAHFSDSPSPIEDDHIPFIRRGANAVDLIDFDYGPGHSYWHTPRDTMDKLSAASFKVIGDVLLEAFRRLQQ